MTDFEIEVIRHQIIERIVLTQDLAASHIAIYLSIVSAFMVIAFVAGKKLSRTQVSIATMAFVFANLMESALIRGSSRAVVKNVRELQELSSGYSPSIAAELWPYLGTGLFFFGLVGPLWFMFDVRKNT